MLDFERVWMSEPVKVSWFNGGRGGLFIVDNFKPPSFKVAACLCFVHTLSWVPSTHDLSTVLTELCSGPLYFLTPGTWCSNRDDRRWFVFFPFKTYNDKLQAKLFSNLLYFTDVRSVFADKIQVARIMLNEWYLSELLSSSPTFGSKGTRDFPLIKPLHSGIQFNRMGRADNKLSKNNVCEARLIVVKSKGRCKTPLALQMRWEDQDKPTILDCEITTL